MLSYGEYYGIRNAGPTAASNQASTYEACSEMDPREASQADP
jgi:hypothetical protein